MCEAPHPTLTISTTDVGGTLLSARWEMFHAANPSVQAVLIAEIDSFIDSHPGERCPGVAFFWERLRWLAFFSTQDPTSAYRLNNDYRAFYARNTMRLRPDLNGWFRLRASAADRYFHEHYHWPN